jgi:hypothetical protein
MRLQTSISDNMYQILTKLKDLDHVNRLPAHNIQVYVYFKTNMDKVAACTMTLRNLLDFFAHDETLSGANSLIREHSGLLARRHSISLKDGEYLSTLFVE